MSHISESIRDLLVRQGIANGLGATGVVRERKVPALSTMASSGGVKADAAGGMHRPIGPHTGGGKRDQSGMGEKAGATKAPAVNREVGNRHRSDSGHMGNTAFRGFVVHTNRDMSRMPMRKRATQTPFLICIEGGKR